MEEGTDEKAWAGLFTPGIGDDMFLSGQVPKRSTHMDQALIKHGPQSAYVTAEDSRPLDQTIESMREEYGWTLDYEDPVYTGTSLTEVTDDDWPSKYPRAHGLRRPAGGRFSATYPEYADMDTDQAGSTVLQKLVSDYMKSGNPGKFRVIQTAPSRFDIVGMNDSEPPVLDATVAVSVTGENAVHAAYEVMRAVKEKTGHRITFGLIPTNVLTQCTAAPKVQQGPARTVILSIFDSCERTLTWRLLYGANNDLYAMNVMPPAIVPAKISKLP